MNIGLEVAAGAVTAGTAILYAATGESFSESAGVVNLGIEGSLLAGALTGYAVSYESGNVWVGVAAGAIAGAFLAFVHAYFVLARGANQLANGLVIMFLALGLTSLFGADYVAKEAPLLRSYDIPLLSDIPWLGDIFFRKDLLTYGTYFLIPLSWWILFRSRWGLLIRGVGERSEVLATYGHPTGLWQYGAVTFGGLLAGIGGAQLSLAYATSWFENLTQGRGFVACAIVIFGSRHPYKVAAGTFLYGAAVALQSAAQTHKWSLIVGSQNLWNQFFLGAIPYLLIIGVLVALGKKRSAEMPEGLQKVFEIA
jgi:simple sugar transport system permease protein